MKTTLTRSTYMCAEFIMYPLVKGMVVSWCLLGLFNADEDILHVCINILLGPKLSERLLVYILPWKGSNRRVTQLKVTNTVKRRWALLRGVAIFPRCSLISECWAGGGACSRLSGDRSAGAAPCAVQAGKAGRPSLS